MPMRPPVYSDRRSACKYQRYHGPGSTASKAAAGLVSDTPISLPLRAQAGTSHDLGSWETMEGRFFSGGAVRCFFALLFWCISQPLILGSFFGGGEKKRKISLLARLQGRASKYEVELHTCRR